MATPRRISGAHLAAHVADVVVVGVVVAKKRRADKPAATGADKDGWRLYLTEDVRFRLRMLAFKRGAKISTVANEVLDKALPRWNLERTD